MGEHLHLDYIREHLVSEILGKLKDETVQHFEIEHSTGLDGFMSTLYNIKVITKTAKGPKERLLIAKFMKGDVAFRESSKSYIQFANEVFIYAKVLPEYEKILQTVSTTEITTDDWVPHAYAAKFGYIEKLSATPNEPEALLVLENLKPHGYMLGPRLFLHREHLLGMCKPVGQYHALGYALRLRDPALFNRLKAEIIPLPFINDNDPNDAKNNLYRALYRVAFDRFFDFFDRCVDNNKSDKPQNEDDLKLIKELRRLREKYFDEPTRLMERLRTQVDESEEDRRFAIILHGDYNRNNVLFHYRGNNAEAGQVDDVKMIDFQELRYGTPAIDLSFFMFMNTSDDMRAEVWMDILKEYHTHMHQTLSAVLKGSNLAQQVVAQVLENYNFANFNAHFARYAFYGVMICMHFLPWMLCSTEECAELSRLFETDMHGKDFHQLSMEAGGDEVNYKLLEIMKYACKMGYMDYI